MVVGAARSEVRLQRLSRPIYAIATWHGVYAHLYPLCRDVMPKMRRDVRHRF